MFAKIWTDADDEILLRYDSTKSSREIAKMIGCAPSTIVKRRQLLNLPPKNQKDLVVVDDCINFENAAKLHQGVDDFAEYNGISSDIYGFAYQLNEKDISIVTYKHGVLRVQKKYLKQFIQELQELYDVFVK